MKKSKFPVRNLPESIVIARQNFISYFSKVFINSSIFRKTLQDDSWTVCDAEFPKMIRKLNKNCAIKIILETNGDHWVV